VTQNSKDLVEGYNFVVESFSNGIHMQRLLTHKITKSCVFWGPKYGYGATWVCFAKGNFSKEKKDFPLGATSSWRRV
jgi:hypothetical protein